MNELSYLFNQIEKLPPKIVITAQLLLDLITKSWKQGEDEEKELMDSIQHPT